MIDAARQQTHPSLDSGKVTGVIPWERGQERPLRRTDGSGLRPLKDKGENDQGLLWQGTQSPSAPTLDVGIQKNHRWETFESISALLCPFQGWNNIGVDKPGGSENQVVEKTGLQIVKKKKAFRNYFMHGLPRIRSLHHVLITWLVCTNGLRKGASCDSMESHTPLYTYWSVILQLSAYNGEEGGALIGLR